MPKKQPYSVVNFFLSLGFSKNPAFLGLKYLRVLKALFNKKSVELHLCQLASACINYNLFKTVWNFAPYKLAKIS